MSFRGILAGPQNDGLLKEAGDPKGYITREQAREGPFVNITGSCDLVREKPVIRLTRMMTRENPIYTASYRRAASIRGSCSRLPEWRGVLREKRLS